MRDSDKNLQTKIMIDKNGFRVRYKNRGELYYKDMSHEMIDDLPEIELMIDNTNKEQWSPPQGWQRESFKRKDMSPTINSYLGKSQRMCSPEANPTQISKANSPTKKADKKTIQRSEAGLWNLKVWPIRNVPDRTSLD